ncbi:DUF3618 domain-containing protein [Dactylosporangium sp. CA-052675]|uniref:DUF3618 domain-containing protein n=1 Tax=Dactylosporangium sp. CA-052675 TaxID=3239927 RepID=UPI003D8E6135
MTADGRVNDPEALRAEIVRTRAALGETLEALAAKTDVKARARAAADRTVHRTVARLSARRTRLVLAAGATMVVGAIVAIALRGRRPNRRS